MRLNNIRSRAMSIGQRMRRLINLWMVEILFDNGSRLLSHNFSARDAVRLQRAAVASSPVVITLATDDDNTLAMPVMRVVSATRINLDTGEAVTMVGEQFSVFDIL